MVKITLGFDDPVVYYFEISEDEEYDEFVDISLEKYNEYKKIFEEFNRVQRELKQLWYKRTFGKNKHE